MKLIRLASESPTGTFDAIFNEDVILDEDSQVALSSMSIETDEHRIIIDANSDTFTFNLRSAAAGSVDRVINLSHTDGRLLADGTFAPTTYNQNNYETLFSDLRAKVNAALVIDTQTDNTTKGGAEVGTQFDISVGKNKPETNKVRLTFAQSKLGPRYADLAKNIEPLAAGGVSVDTTPRSDYPALTAFNTWGKAAGLASAADNLSMTYSTYPITEGAGVFRARVDTWVDVGGDANLASGSIIALTSSPPAEYTTAMTDAQINFGIHADKVAGTYKVILNGVWTDTGVAVAYGTDIATRPRIELAISGGNVIGNIYQTVGGASQISRAVISVPVSVASRVTLPLYPVAIFRGAQSGASGCLFTDIRLTTDPFKDTANLTPTQTNENTDSTLGVGLPPKQNTSPSNYFMEFESPNLAAYLGFDGARSPRTLPDLNDFQKEFISDRAFSYTDLSDAFLVLLDNIKLNSYDSYDVTGTNTGGRQNLLAVCPADDIGNTIIYEPNNLLFIDINNTSKQYIRNIQARILKNDYSAISTNGLSSLVLIFKSKAERM